MKKYFKTKAEANKVKSEREARGFYGLHVWRMPKGTKHYGEFAVCNEIEYLNTY